MVLTSDGRQWLVVVALLAMLVPGTGRAEAVDLEAAAMQPKGFVIVRSTTSYAEARAFAKRAAATLRVPLDLRDLTYDARHGMTFSREACEASSWEYPCFSPRGRWDDGVYVSVEPSDAYATFRPGLFVVVVASGAARSNDLAFGAGKARAAFPDAYVKDADVYQGCMH